MAATVNDLLGGASLLLAVVSVLYGLWYTEIVKAIEITPYSHYADRGGQRKDVRSMLWNKAVPLVLAAFLVAAVFLPDSIRLMIKSVTAMAQLGFGPALRYYNAVQTAFLAVEGLALALTVHTFNMMLKLRSLLRSINKPDEKVPNLKPR